MRQIICQPQRLDASASIIDSLNQEYQRLFSQLFQAVDTMQNNWNGKDNLAFSNQIKGFHDDLKQLSNIMTQYSEFLKNTARAYRETQDEIYNQAKALVN